MSDALQGRIALITGVSRRAGIGFAIASRLSSLGADLCLHGWRGYDATQPWGADPGGLADLAEQARAGGGRVAWVEADLSDPAAPERVMEAAARLGHVDILVANHAHSRMGALEALDAEDVDRHLQVNVRATLLLVRAFAARHDGRPGGRVILLTSGQQRHPMPEELAYAASKGALAAITRSLARHLGPRGITVNTVNPGATDTGYASPALYEAVRRREPRGRWGTPADAARLVAWLATDDADWITGEVIHSTGGGP